MLGAPVLLHRALLVSVSVPLAPVALAMTTALVMDELLPSVIDPTLFAPLPMVSVPLVMPATVPPVWFRAPTLEACPATVIFPAAGKVSVPSLMVIAPLLPACSPSVRLAAAHVSPDPMVAVWGLPVAPTAAFVVPMTTFDVLDGTAAGVQLSTVTHFESVDPSNRDCPRASPPASSARVSTAITIRIRFCIFIAFPPFFEEVFSLQFSVFSNPSLKTEHWTLKTGSHPTHFFRLPSLPKFYVLRLTFYV
jgi:hypothetical protein